MATVRNIYEGLKRHDGSLNELARRCNCSRQWVRQVLTEVNEDSELLLEAAKLWNELERIEAKRLADIDRLVQETEQLSAANYATA